MTAAPARANPFRGPRSFQTGDTLYGRDREARELLALLIAERIVLLHSPSGAGKTSLVQAALLPALADREFSVPPVVRVGTAPAAGAGANRYVRSTLLSLEEGLPPAEQLPAAELDGLSLAAYLARRIPADADPVLLFDQFEEVLTRDPTDIAAKHAFFVQLGHALRERRYRALFSMREDYVAALEPYLRHLPTRLDVRYRLDLLGVAGATQALGEPARRAGVTFAPEAVGRLVDDLRVVNVQRADGEIEQQLGPHVEPVQLQVLGLRLWQRLAPDATTISADDVAAIGDVNQALGDYYADSVGEVVRAGGVSERAVRSWFDQELITPQGVRGQVLQGQGESAGLDNGAIRALVDAYLVRAEPRRGATWFELAHDRLIGPVRANNAGWEAGNLSTLQRQADLWERQGRPAGLLLRGDTLREAEQWAEQNTPALTPTDRDFLQLCRDARRQSQRVRNLAIGASVAAALASLAFVTALWFFNRAEEQRRLAEQNARLSRARELAAASVVSQDNDAERSLLLGLAAVEATRGAGEPVTAEAEQALQRAALAARSQHTLHGHDGEVNALAYSPDGATLASVADDGTLRLWDVASGDERAALDAHDGAALALAYSPNGATLASAGEDGTLRLWDVATETQRLELLAAGEANFIALAFSPDGALIAATDSAGSLLLWDVADGAERLALPVVEDMALAALAFSPDGGLLAAADDSGDVRVWELAALLGSADPAPAQEFPSGVTEPTGLAYSPDGELLVAVGAELRAAIRSAATGAPEGFLAGHSSSLYGVSFSPDGALIATASADGTANVWDYARGKLLVTMSGHSGYVNALAFSPGGSQLATAGADGSLRLWSLRFVPSIGATALAASPDGATLAAVGSDGAQLFDAATGLSLARIAGYAEYDSAAAFSPDGATLAVGSDDGVVRLWEVAALRADAGAEPVLELIGHADVVARIAFSPDGRLVASAGDDQSVRLWDSSDGRELQVFDDFADAVYGLAFSPDGARLAAADRQGRLAIWDTETGAELGGAEVGEALNILAFSPDGAQLAAGADDGRIYRYGADGAALDPIVHGAAVDALAYAADATLASGSSGDGTIRLWPAGGAPRATLPVPAQTYALTFLSPRRLAALGSDGVVYAYPLALDDLIAAARGELTRGPTADECTTYRLPEGCQ